MQFEDLTRMLTDKMIKMHKITDDRYEFYWQEMERICGFRLLEDNRICAQYTKIVDSSTGLYEFEPYNWLEGFLQ
jgi:hypothetical protein